MVTTATSWFGARNKHSQHNAGKDRTWPRHARRKGGVDAQTPHDCSARLGQCQDTTKGHITAPQQRPPVKRQHHHEEGELPPTGDVVTVCLCVCVCCAAFCSKGTRTEQQESPEGILLTIRGHLGDVHPSHGLTPRMSGEALHMTRPRSFARFS